MAWFEVFHGHGPNQRPRNHAGREFQMNEPRTAGRVTLNLDGDEPKVEVTFHKTAEQEAREAKFNQAAEEAFGEGRRNLPEKLWELFGTGTDKQRLAKGVTVPGFGQQQWFGYSSPFEMSSGERVNLQRGAKVLWPQFRGGENYLATVEPGQQEGELETTYYPGYPKGTRKNKRPRPRIQTFSEADGSKAVRKVRRWIQEQVDSDPVAQSLREEDAPAKRQDMETPRRRRAPRREQQRRRANTPISGPFTGFEEAAVIDVETTGLSPERDRIVEVAIARSDFSVLLRGEKRPYFKTFEARVNPRVPIPKAASDLHGIHDEDVAEEGGFEEVAEELRDFIGDRPVVGHNVGFDTRFLNAEFERANVRGIHENKSYCTMRRFREAFPGEGSSLDAVAARIGRSRKTEIHGALEDALLTAAVAGNFYMVDNEAKEPHASEDNGSRREGGSATFWWIGIAIAIGVGLVLVVV